MRTGHREVLATKLFRIRVAKKHTGVFDACERELFHFISYLLECSFNNNMRRFAQFEKRPWRSVTFSNVAD